MAHRFLSWARLKLYIALYTAILLSLNARHYICFTYAVWQKKQVYAIARVVWGAFLDLEEVTSLTVGFISRPGHSSFEDHKICWEAPVVIAMWGANGPLCGMALELKPGVIHIRQLQGVSGVPLKGIVPDWTQRFVRACIRFARLTGIPCVRLSNADVRIFYHAPTLPESVVDRDAAKKELQRRLRVIYEGTGRKVGLRSGKNWSEWTNPNRARIP